MVVALRIVLIPNSDIIIIAIMHGTRNVLDVFHRHGVVVEENELLWLRSRKSLLASSEERKCESLSLGNPSVAPDIPAIDLITLSIWNTER